jgi:undecaprenyl-diphosphatase
MNLFEGILLGILQGLTEWLPISSSGQSMLFLINLLHISPEEAFSISIMLHIGSLLAVIYYFRRKITDAFSNEKSLLNFVVFASITSGVFGYPLYTGMRSMFSSISGEAVTMFIGVTLIITGIVLKNTNGDVRMDFNNKDAVFTGGAQGFAVLPGISRSGTTIAALLFRGVEQETALSLSFILAIPAIIGIIIFDARESGLTIFTLPLISGIITSFFVSLLTMHYLIALARKVDFSGFVIAMGSLAFFAPLLLILLEWIIQS